MISAKFFFLTFPQAVFFSCFYKKALKYCCGVREIFFFDNVFLNFVFLHKNVHINIDNLNTMIYIKNTKNLNFLIWSSYYDAVIFG